MRTLQLRYSLLACALALPTFAGNAIEQRAVQAAQSVVAKECTSDKPCTFKAYPDVHGWKVIVTFTKRNSPSEKPLQYPGGYEVIVLDKHFKVIDTLPGE